MLRRLLEANYFGEHETASPERVRFWLVELRTRNCWSNCSKDSPVWGLNSPRPDRCCCTPEPAISVRCKTRSTRKRSGNPKQTACLHGLLAIGHRLVLAAARFTPDELGCIGATRKWNAVSVENLQISLSEWRHCFSPGEVCTAQEAPFGAQT